MKMTMKKGMLSVALILTLILGVVFNASARFWGWETTGTTDWSDGTCTYPETCRVHYIFWIGGSEECTTVTIGCL
jgi:hypothetical protein